MLSLHTFGPNFQRRLGQLTQGNLLNAGPVVLRWNSAAAPADRNLEESYAEVVAAELTVQALIHYVSMRTVERGFAEMQAGDAIVTFNGSEELTQEGLVFELPDGRTYVQAAVGKKLNEFWDVVIGGVPLSRTLLLRLVPTQRRPSAGSHLTTDGEDTLTTEDGDRLTVDAPHLADDFGNILTTDDGDQILVE